MTMTKKETIKLLERQAKYYLANGTKQDKERAMRTYEVIELLERCKCNNYHIQRDNKNHINLGYILESALLDTMSLLKEDETHEIKSLVNNTPNVLKNENVKVVYVVIVKASKKGVYKYDAKDVYNKRLTLNVLNELDGIYCGQLSRALGF